MQHQVATALVTLGCFALLATGSLFRFDGPASNSLIGYWPFDNTSKLQELRYQHRPNYQADWYYPVEFVDGPFENQLSYGLSNAPPSTTLVTYDSVTLPVNATISFYFYSGDAMTPPMDSVFCRFGEKSKSLSFSYTESSYQPEFAFNLIGNESLHYRNYRWNFIAMTLTNSKLLTIFNAAGAEIWSGSTMEPMGELTKLSIGPLKNGDRLSCFALFDRILKPAEIARLPCVCQRRGNCDGSVGFKAQRCYHGPARSSIINYWPLFDAENGLGGGLDDIVRANYPFEVDAVGFYPPRGEALKSPPFVGAPRLLHSSIYSTNLQRWLASYSQVFLPESFSVSFYLYRPKDRDNVTSVLFHTWSRLIVKARGDNLSIFTGVGNETLLVEVPVLQNYTDVWDFVAFTYDHVNNGIKFYNEAGNLLAKYDQIEIPLENDKDLVDISVGPAWPEASSMICLALFKKVLNENEIKGLRRACQSSAISASKKSNYLGPKRENLIDFWTLFASEYCHLPILRWIIKNKVMHD